MKRTAHQIKSTAYHEAGHAVIGRVLMLPCGRATIRPNYAEGEAGHSITPDPYRCLYEWEKRGKLRDTAAVWHARIITYMAGAETEGELLGKVIGGDDDDRWQIELMACSEGYRTEDNPRTAEWQRLEPRLRAMTRMLVRRHRLPIERVAKALLLRTTLSAKQIDKLIQPGASRSRRTVNGPAAVFARP